MAETPAKKKPGPASAPAPKLNKDGEPIVVFSKSTAAEDKAAITRAQDDCKTVNEQMKLKFREIQTEHFIIFTDWDAREDVFLKKYTEIAYTRVAKMFELSPKDNVFVGKLPIYMFADGNTFRKFSKDMLKIDTPPSVLGYFATRSDGSILMAMWQPAAFGDQSKRNEAEREWGYTLVHEFSHAFVARYRTNQHLPRWLDEGIAEVVAQSQFPRQYVRAFARQMSEQADKQVTAVFDESVRPGGDMYPVMMTMVEVLIRENPKKFLAYFNAIKDGQEGEPALKSIFGMDYPALKRTWKIYIRTAKDQA